MNRLNIGELSERARRTFRNLLYAIKWGSSPLDEEMNDGECIITVRPLLGEEAEKVVNCGRTFSELQRVLKISSRTLAKYLKICEENSLVTGYRCGKSVKYYLTEKGRQLLHELLNYCREGHTFLLSPLALLALSYPKARFVKGPPPMLIIDRAEISLEPSPRFELDRMPEGRVYCIFLKLVRGLGYEAFSREDLEAMNIKIMWRLSTPVIGHRGLEKLEALKRVRGIRVKPIYKIIHLIQWANLMSSNLDRYYGLVQGKECMEIRVRPDKLITFILNNKREVTHIIV